ncbi:MAG: TRAP transporter large permease subunit [Nannocystaceae bacterium]
MSGAGADADERPSGARRLATLLCLAILCVLLGRWVGEEATKSLRRLGESLWPGYSAELRRAPERPRAPPRIDPPAAATPRPTKTLPWPGEPGFEELSDEDKVRAIEEQEAFQAAQAAQAPAKTLPWPSEEGFEALSDEDKVLAIEEQEAAQAVVHPPVPEDSPKKTLPWRGEPGFDALSDDDKVLAIEEQEAAQAVVHPPVPEDSPKKTLPWRGEPGFDALSDDDKVLAIEEQEAADAAPEATPAVDPVAAHEARVEAEARRYADAVATWASIHLRRTAALRTYAAIDEGLSKSVAWLGAHLRHAFLALIALGGWVATATRRHISMRSIHGRRSDRIAQSAALIANLLLVASVVAQARSTLAAGTGNADLGLTVLWLAAFGGMALLNLVHVARPRPPAAGETALAGLLCVPLYAVMAVLASAYFLVVSDYPEGLAVYLEMLLGNAPLYLNVALYVWAGMLLSRTRIAERFFEVLRPFGLPPELLTIVVVALAALPTAYSGASGIFVIAAGALIYRELRAAGARSSLALASTAMSGSLGVVLSPCLLVVIVAYLCNDVGSDELFGWGRWVYVLTASLFALVVLLTRQGSLRPAPAPGALARSARALRSLLPHGLALAAILMVFKLALGTDLDQDSAPFILPLWLLLVLAIERRLPRAGAPDDAPARAPARAATAETTVHVGALLLLMALSAGLGGVIERSGVIQGLPLLFASPWEAMAGLSVALVIIGMIMDPYGAVILVNATLYAIARESGIDPVHFWMVVLVAFELGYLTPPVALNHLLTRQVVGEAEEDAPPPGAGLWRRHERVLLPITVMVIALLVVAFAPLAWRGR